MKFKIKSYFLYIISIGMLILMLTGCAKLEDAHLDNNSTGSASGCQTTDGRPGYYVANLDDSTYSCEPATLFTSDNTTDWSYKVYYNTDKSDMKTNLDALGESNLKTKLTAIMNENIATFGSTPQPVGTEPATIFFVTEIPCSTCGGGFVAGFFDSRHNSATATNSNKLNMLVMNGKDGLADATAQKEFFNTLAHELQHLIHYGKDSNEETWVDEGLAEMAAHINRSVSGQSLFESGSSCTNYYNCYIRDLKSMNLLGWVSEPKHYAKVALFFNYLYDKIGDDANGKAFLKAVISNTNTGVTGVETALNAAATTIEGSLTGYSTNRDTHGISPAKNFTFMYLAWLVATSNKANSVSSGDLSDYKYTNFTTTPYWSLNSESDLTNWDKSPFSAVSLDRSSYSGSSSISNNSNIRIITINDSGNVNFNTTDLSSFTGEEIVTNINPYYRISSATALNLDSTGSSLEIGTVTAKTIPTDTTGYLTFIGNVPFVELVLVTPTGSRFSLIGDKAKELRSKVGAALSIEGNVTGQSSRRGYPEVSVIGYKM